MLFYLPRSVKAWGTEEFRQTFQLELAGLGLEVLPLQQGLSSAGYALDEDISTMMLGVEPDGQILHIRVGIFFKGAIPGCSCADDPAPEETYNEYCELQVDLALDSGRASLRLRDWGPAA